MSEKTDVNNIAGQQQEPVNNKDINNIGDDLVDVQLSESPTAAVEEPPPFPEEVTQSKNQRIDGHSGHKYEREEDKDVLDIMDEEAKQSITITREVVPPPTQAIRPSDRVVNNNLATSQRRTSDSSGAVKEPNHHYPNNVVTTQPQASGESSGGIENDQETDTLSSSSSPVPVSPPHRTLFVASVRPAPPPSAKETSNESGFFVYLVQSKRLSQVGGVSPVKKSSSPQQEQLQSHPEQTFTVKRVWEDFEFLHSCLTLAAFPSSNGLIIPSLLPKVVPSPEGQFPGVNAYDHILRAASKASCSSSSNPFVKSMISSGFRSDCHQLEEYLNLMLSHPTFGKNVDVWERFLTSEKPAPRVKAGASGNSSSATSSSSFKFNSSSSSQVSAILSHRDCDEFFQREREWAHVYTDSMKNSLECLNNKMAAKSSEYFMSCL